MAYGPHDITPIGYHNFRGNNDQKFGIKLDDRRRHIYVVGKTGVGKSTLLENMAIADIRSGKGLAIIDPHGEFAERLLDFVPEERLDDVIYFDPSDMEYPIAFNPMEQVGNEFRHLVASGIMGVFKKIWVDAWSARMEYILNNTLLALLELPNSTLLGVLRMFAEPPYRKKIVDNLQDPVIKAFWQNEFARYSQKLETEALAAIQNKVGQFVSNPLIRNILGQSRSTINMREIMDTGKIFIANLSKGKMGEDNSALLGAMIISRLQLAAMSRVDIPEEKRRDFFMYVDEFQNFATDSFASILSEARKYHLSLTLAHQYIGQLVTNDGNTKVRDAVFGNVGTIITFRIGAADGEFLEKEFMPEFLQNDLVNLAKANVYIKLMIDGVSSKPFSATTLPPQEEPLQSYKDIIIKNTREHYGTPRKVVEEKIASEWQANSDTVINEKIGRRDERPLSQVLRPDGPRPPRSQSSSPRASAPAAPRSPATGGSASPATSPPASRYAPPARPAPVVRPSPEKAVGTPSLSSAVKNMDVAELPEGEAADVWVSKKAPSASSPSAGTGAPASAPSSEPSSETQPAAPAPKQFVRQKVDIEALRRSITESLKKQSEGGSVAAPTPVPDPTQVNTEPPGTHSQ
ncbi:MAG TPA: type IV secretion system DNA-binding domain-containing protein [Candidatus Paceibacterota bacterium]|nr:type IV secretion system DNA-binding domain-containing protein [Candidatus Paceibacterota bacterium]